MQRLFVAIPPPRVIREQLILAMGGVSGARWQSEDQLHITLRFIGEVDRRVAEDVALALQSVRQAPFEVKLSGIGSFDRRGQPAALWAGLSPAEPLKALHKKVDQACIRAGLEPERRAYHPHITLARLGRTAGPIAASIHQLAALGSAPFPVTSFGMYESVLTPAGAVYSLVDRYLLG